MPILGLTIVAVIGVLMVPSSSIFRSVPQNNTPSMTSPSLAFSSVSHCQGNARGTGMGVEPKCQLKETEQGRRQNSRPLTTNFSQNVTELTGSCVPMLHSNPMPQRWYKRPFVTCHIHFANRSPMFPSMILSSDCGEF